MEMQESMTLCMSALYLTNETNEQRLRDVTVDNKKKVYEKGDSSSLPHHGAKNFSKKPKHLYFFTPLTPQYISFTFKIR